MTAKTILLVGPPNSGKTSLFNSLTNSKHKTVNYPGSTVDYALGKLSRHSITVIDSPGIHSLKARTLDEEVTLQTLTNTDKIVSGACKTPNLVVVVLDGSQLERQLILARQFQRLNIPMVLVISKRDLETQVFPELDIKALETLLKCPIQFISTSNSEGLSELVKTMVALTKDDACPIDPSKGLGNVIDDYTWAERTYSSIKKSSKTSQGFDLDRLFLHPVFAPFIFVGIMFLFFWAIFSLAGPFMDIIDGFFGSSVEFLNTTLPDSFISRFLSDGIVSGLGAVFVFVPQIFILFLFMGAMESSGYLARGAVIIDRPLSMIGLSGKSFVPLLSGCACAIPAMMAARTIPDKKERLMTLFVIPLMQCSARLPVYGLLLALLLADKPAYYSGLAMTSIYVGSIVFASVVAAIAGRVMGFKPHQASFDIELPLWHRPAIKNTLLQAIDQTWSFCKNAGPTIVVVSIVLWLSSVFPSEDLSLIHIISGYLEPVLAPMGVDGRVGVALILSFAAREVFVSALAVIFSVGEEGLLMVMQDFSMASLVGLVLFFMISMQCMATLAVAKKEMGGWKLPVIMTVVYIGLGYLLAVLAYQVLS